MQNYVINGVKVNFDLASYLSNSLGVSRKDMPQVNMEKFLKILPMYQKYINIEVKTYRANELMPTQNEINYSNVLINAAQRTLEDDQLVFICSNDLHLIDGHHRHVECLITTPERAVTCYVFDLSTEDLLNLIRKTSQILDASVCIQGETQSNVPVSENLAIFQMLVEHFGMQGPEASAGMGSVEFPAVSQDAGDILDTSGRGSGDIPGTIDYSKRLRDLYKRKGLDENGELPKEMFESFVELVNESMGDISPEEWNNMAQVKSGAGRFITTSELKEIGQTHRDKLKILQDLKDSCTAGSWSYLMQCLNSETIDESSEEFTTYEIVCRDSEQSLLGILEHIQKVGNTGHSMTIVVDEGCDDEKKFGWDGDGSDYIKSIKKIEPKNESLNEDGNLKLPKHFENADGLELLTCINKPVKRKCLQIDEPFSCNTLEGITQGKKGDMLVQGVDGEIYPCDKEIFDATYLIVGELEETKE